jgi:hypothetical protein
MNPAPDNEQSAAEAFNKQSEKFDELYSHIPSSNIKDNG